MADWPPAWLGAAGAAAARGSRMDIIDTLYLGTPANQALDAPLTQEQKKSMIDAAAQKLTELMEILRIDHRSDPNTQDTPHRVARMYVNELLAGRFTAPPRLTEFDCVETSSDLMVTGPIEMRSTCAHHLMPIFGSAIIGVIAADGRDHRPLQVRPRGPSLRPPLPGPGGADPPDRRLSDGAHRAARPRRAAARGAHVQDPSRRARQPQLADDQQRLLRRAQGRPEAQGGVPRGMPKPRSGGPAHDGRVRQDAAHARVAAVARRRRCTARPRLYDHNEGLSCCFRQWRAEPFALPAGPRLCAGLPLRVRHRPAGREQLVPRLRRPQGSARLAARDVRPHRAGGRRRSADRRVRAHGGASG